MNSSHRADVIVASPEFRADFDEQVAEALDEIAAASAIEHADVAPDPARRIILVAPTKTAGAVEARERGIDPVAVVTPRSPHAAYGLTADDIVWSDALTAEDRAELEPHVLPSLATTKA